MMGMTIQQRKAYDFIKESIKTRGVSPSYDEIAIHCGSTARSNAHRLVHALADNGYLRIRKGVRALEIIEKDSAETHLQRVLYVIRDTSFSEHPAVKDALNYLYDGSGHLQIANTRSQ